MACSSTNVEWNGVAGGKTSCMLAVGAMIAAFPVLLWRLTDASVKMNVGVVMGVVGGMGRFGAVVCWMDSCSGARTVAMEGRKGMLLIGLAMWL